MMELRGVFELMDAFEDLAEAMDPKQGYSIGTNVRYASFQEFGTSYQSGKPHLRPAFDEVVAMHADAIAAQYDDAEKVVTEIAMMIERKTKIRAPVDTGNLRDSYRAEPL